jgi:uncharacterized membrane-anchored protein
VPSRALLSQLTAHGAPRVAEITIYFWVITALSTAMGESTLAPWPSGWRR